MSVRILLLLVALFPFLGLAQAPGHEAEQKAPADDSAEITRSIPLLLKKLHATRRPELRLKILSRNLKTAIEMALQPEGDSDATSEDLGEATRILFGMSANTSESPEVRDEAFLLFSKCLQSPPIRFSDFKEKLFALYFVNVSLKQRQMIAELLMNQLPVSEYVGYFGAETRNKDPRHVELAITALTKLGPEKGMGGLPFIAEALEKATIDQVRQIATLLPDLGLSNDAITKRLNQVLSKQGHVDSSSDVVESARVAAVEALRKVGNLDDETLDALSGIVKNYREEPEFRLSALKTLMDLAEKKKVALSDSKTRQAIQYFKEMAENQKNESLERGLAMRVLAGLGTAAPENKEAVSLTLIKGMGDENEVVRASAARGLGTLGKIPSPNHSQMVSALSASVKDESPLVRREAGFTIYEQTGSFPVGIFSEVLSEARSKKSARAHTILQSTSTRDLAAIVEQLPEPQQRDSLTLLLDRLKTEDGEGLQALKAALWQNLSLDPKINPKSFEFHEITFPEGGKKITLGDKDESNNPEHEVVLAKSFAIQRTPVTQAQYALVMGENPSQFKNGGFELGKTVVDPNRPVEMVSWNDARKYVEKLNALDPKHKYSLPTEAQWEYATRGGTRTKYFFGDEESGLADYAWFNGNSGSETHPVALKKPNAFGLYDTSGNVWQWVEDCYGNVPPEGVDPTGPTTGSNRVVRGGSWYDDAQYLRSALRSSSDPGNRNDCLGFRLVRTAE